MKRLFWFLAAGSGGFLIDAGLTHFLVTLAGFSPFASRIPAIMAAMSFTWLVNRNRTFDKSPHSLAVEGFRYWAVGITSALLNYAIYAALMYRAPFLQPIVAVMAGSAGATLYSFFGYSRFVFGR
ncbi:GtrA family protein [Neorhizobium lilium]|uniref:GtrA family protein n=1 Tax=Neorhizobium lilium TaxID=2503024 RepID=A0A3S3RS84_9HYPH|nr:GtrA family protein [Neorhizobium lilium]RWX76711.1 GtrA family protein [Neorhizobium lilium]